MRDNAAIRSNDKAVGVLIFLMANVAGGEPYGVFRRARGGHGGEDEELPVVGSGGVVLRMQNELRALGDAFGKTKTLEADNDADFYTAKFPCLEGTAGGVGGSVKWGEAGFVVKAQNFAVLVDDDGGVVRFALGGGLGAEDAGYSQFTAALGDTLVEFVEFIGGHGSVWRGDVDTVAGGL